MTRQSLRAAVLASVAVSPLLGSVIHAQVPPTDLEIRAYSGLHAAAAAGDLAKLRAVIGQQPDLEQRDGHGRTAVHVATHAGHQDALRDLAKAGADLKALDRDRYDAITIAAVRNDPAMVRLAIDLGGDPRAITSPYAGTALIAAAHLGHADVVRVLIAAKAPLDHVNNLGWTATIEAVVLGDGGPQHQATLLALVEAGADVSLADRAGRTPLDAARSRGYTDMIRIIEGRRR